MGGLQALKEVPPREGVVLPAQLTRGGACSWTPPPPSLTLFMQTEAPAPLSKPLRSVHCVLQCVFPTRLPWAMTLGHCSPGRIAWCGVTVVDFPCLPGAEIVSCFYGLETLLV